MSKKILLIDSDESFAQGLSNAMKARGFSARLATDSEQGMSMAKEQGPDLIVVCVEAQPTNGYMLCTRLKKDDQLKSIPVILISSTATADSFEKHKKLKTRAEEYLIKPFAPQAMLEKASQLLGVKLGAGSGGDEEIVSVEDEPLGLADLGDGEDEPISLSAADAAEARSTTSWRCSTGHSIRSAPRALERLPTPPLVFPISTIWIRQGPRRIRPADPEASWRG